MKTAEDRHDAGLRPATLLTVGRMLAFAPTFFIPMVLSRRLVEHLAADDGWRTDPAHAGSELWVIAKALVHRPRVAFLDEPTAGVDVALRRDLWNYVRLLRAEGTTIVLKTPWLGMLTAH